MKLRVPAIVATALFLGSVAVWFWVGGIGDPRSGPAVRGVKGGHAVPRAQSASSSSDASHERTPSGGPDHAAVPASSGASTPQAVPVRITSSVMPGVPVGRRTSAWVPDAASLRGNSRGAVSFPESEGRAAVENVRIMVRDFRTRMGENPVGTNAEIMTAVMGDNPAKARLGPPEGQTLNDKGELVDQWGTPYFFHQESKDTMEIRSAGPDRKMWTSDDVVTQ